jgi:hypothetical protein
MAIATQPVQALIDLPFQNATLSAPTAAPPANTAKQNAEPQDTVTIANADPGGAQAAQVFSEVQVQLQQVDLIVKEVPVPLLNATAANTAAPAPPAIAANANPAPQGAAANGANPAVADPAATNAANTANAAAASNLAPPAVNTAANAANNTTQDAQQQELAQLAQVLQQLGIPPSSIPVVQQLAMLLFRFDPQALLQFVNALQGMAQQVGNQVPANNANAAPAPKLQNIAANTSTGQNGGFEVQFQELQLTFTAVGIEPAVATPQAAAAVAGAGAGCGALNVGA